MPAAQPSSSADRGRLFVRTVGAGSGTARSGTEGGTIAWCERINWAVAAKYLLCELYEGLRVSPALFCVDSRVQMAVHGHQIPLRLTYGSQIVVLTLMPRHLGQETRAH